METVRNENVWSDRFFYFAAKEAKGGKSVESDETALFVAASIFRSAHPDCPYDEEWLVADFMASIVGGL